MTELPETQILRPAENAGIPKQDDRQVVVSAETLAAYEAASYVVDLPSGEITLRIGERFHPPAGLGPCTRLAVVTACNPYSELLEQDENAARQADLVKVIEAAELAWFPAAGIDPTGAWESEPSFGVLDPSYEQLDDWMERFGQNAVVVTDIGFPVRLRRHPRSSSVLDRSPPATLLGGA